jgi:hypothetical protein
MYSGVDVNVMVEGKANGVTLSVRKIIHAMIRHTVGRRRRGAEILRRLHLFFVFMGFDGGADRKSLFGCRGCLPVKSSREQGFRWLRSARPPRGQAVVSGAPSLEN